MNREKQRISKKSKKRPASPPVDTLTVVWMTTLATALICEAGALATRVYVGYFDPHATLLKMLSAYLLLTAALIGVALLLLTPVVVKRRRSNPPGLIVAAAYFIGAAPWAAMILQAWE